VVSGAWLEQLDRVAGGVLQQDRVDGHPGGDVRAESRPCSTQRLDRCREVID
jgi:hypothetical protein